MKVVWSKQAMESLANIYDYIYEDSPKNAEMVFNTLLGLGNSLSNPTVEYAMDLIINETPYRSIPKWSYKIVYRKTRDRVIVLEVFNTKQNPDKLKGL